MENEVLDVVFERGSDQCQRTCGFRFIGGVQRDTQVSRESVAAAEVHPMLLVVDAVVPVETRTERRQLPDDCTGSDDEPRVRVIDVSAHPSSVATLSEYGSRRRPAARSVTYSKCRFSSGSLRAFLAESVIGSWASAGPNRPGLLVLVSLSSARDGPEVHGLKRTKARILERNRSVRTISGGLPTLGRRR